MKVLKKAAERKVGRKLTCSNCGALLLVVPRDVKSYQSYCYDGSSDTEYYVKCPECNKDTHVSYKYQYLPKEETVDGDD